MASKNFNKLATTLPSQLIEMSEDDLYSLENSIVAYILGKKSNKSALIAQITGNKQPINNKVIETLEKNKIPRTIEAAIDLFETLINPEDVKENGMVFTPLYIAEYITSTTLGDIKIDNKSRVIDPSSGCGIFLIAAALNLSKKTGKPIDSVFEENIFGIELHLDTARRCEIAMRLYSYIVCGQIPKRLNIYCADSLKQDWKQVTRVENFDAIIGNPPYVNTHDLSKETVKFLKQNYQTTKQGVFNIFYAFIERSLEYLSPKGEVGFIVPNNFLYIKSAKSLRMLLTKNKNVNRIIDFADNMVFKPVRTYSCLLYLGHSNNELVEYSVIKDKKNIEESLQKIKLSKVPVSQLDDTGWHLVDEQVSNNIYIIENQFRQLKEFIRTGIATLKDNIYIVDKDASGYYKIVDGKRFEIESQIVKPIYKVPELKPNKSLRSIERYIIFPYSIVQNKATIIPEDDLKQNSPNTYKYLLYNKQRLAKRDKGKANKVAWYAYGRTQGLTKFGEKLFFPTFSNKPQFKYSSDKYALFCNGYAVFENDYIPLSILEKILNSSLMDYYIKNTSYQIEGSYYCYQKKYIEKFSLPILSSEQLAKIKKLEGVKLDAFLLELYGLSSVK